MNPDIKWTEEWFEIECSDSSEILDGNEETKSQKINVKFYSKLWTNIDENTIQGESCFQILNKNHVL